MSAPAADQAWAMRARAGSAAAFEVLVRTHHQALRAFLRRVSGDHAEADDGAQAAFVFAWEQIARFDPNAGSFRAWLFAIAWRKHAERRRGQRRARDRETAYAQASEAAHPPDPGLRLDLATAMRALPEEARAALLLCLALDFTQNEAAAALALPLGTVKSHISRGREKLSAFLGDAE